MNYEPVECKIFEENQNKCFQFWDRVSDRYAEKGIFSERGGYPDKEAETTIKTLLISNKSLPYNVSVQYSIDYYISYISLSGDF